MTIGESAAYDMFGRCLINTNKMTSRILSDGDAVTAPIKVAPNVTCKFYDDAKFKWAVYLNRHMMPFLLEISYKPIVTSDIDFIGYLNLLEEKSQTGC